MNYKEIASAIEGYKEYFPEHFKDEKYKWEAVKHFQDNWDIEAEDFGAMFKKATQKAGNLLASVSSFPRGMILEFAKADNEATRQMFRNLYDESIDLAQRIDDFVKASEDMRARYNDGTWKNHYQNTNAISVYLWLRYPDKYYIYKYGIYSDVSKEFESDFIPKLRYSANNIVSGYAMYDEICRYLQADKDIRKMLDSLLTERCYPDTELKTTTVDFGFYVSRFYSSLSFEKAVETIYNAVKSSYNSPYDDTSNDDKATYLSEIIAALKELGGTGSLSEIHSRIIERGLLSSLNSNPNWKNAVSLYIQSHCNETQTYKEGNENIFYSVNGLGKGVWGLIGYDPLEYDSSKRYWLYAPSSNASLWDEFYDEGIMGIGWDEIDDLRNYKTRDEMKKKLQEYNNSNKSFHVDTLALWQFTYEMQPGDIVIVKKGLYKIIGCGIVNSDYCFDDEREIFKHIRKVKWIRKGIWDHPGQAAMKTLTDITKYSDYVQNLLDLFEEETCDPAVFYETYTKEDFLSDVFMSEKEYDKLTALLKRKKNIILQGAPGVGKTYCAKRLAWSLMGEKDNDRVCTVQFHQSYSYEDFIMGYRPDESGGFELQEGVFYLFCEKAKNDPENDYYFIIDEINRGNLSKIFGELLMLIENDKRGEDHQIELIYGNEPFYIPENLHIIGMMNTADRSLAMIDYALRRRFSFYTMHPAFEKADENGFADYTNEIDCPLYHSVIDRIKELNKAIKDDSALGSGFEIGHSYFTSESTDMINDEWVKNVVEYEIIPLIEEYWFDNEAECSKWKEKLYHTIGEPYDE